jgi:LysM repeat protein
LKYYFAIQRFAQKCINTKICRYFLLEEKMTVKRLLVFLVLALFAVGLAACELSASTPPPTTLTSESPMGTLQSELEQIATQTAAAGGGIVLIPTTEPPPPGPADEATPTPAAPEEGEVVVTEPAEPEEAPTEAVALPTPAPVAQPTPGIPTTYVLQRGEFPFCIARRFNVNQTELLNLNGLGVNSRPDVGTTLRIPQTGNPFVSERALRPHPATYTVSAGDTLNSIACLYGDVDPNAIAQANGLTAPYNLTPGQQLHIP